MSTKKKLLEAAAGAVGGVVYVDDVFNTFLYTGTDANNITATTGLDMSGEGGMVWFKGRSAVENHMIVDSARGVDYGIYTDATGAQFSISGLGFAAPTFTSTGFTVGDAPVINRNTTDTYVAWSFRKQPGFFDVVTYTGDGATSRDINHNLGTSPGAIIIKRIDSTSDWTFQHRYNNNYVQYLNSTAAQSDSGATLQFNSTNFKVVGPPSGLANDKCTNVSGATYVAYLFAHDAQDFGTGSNESIIKCGSYTGTGVAGNEIDLGWEPQWVMVKCSTAADKWTMYDTMRGIETGDNGYRLWANESSAESGYNNSIDVTSTGFKKMSALSNESGQTYIYMAIRRPNKPASKFAATDLFTPASGLNASANGKVFATTYPVDLSIATNTVDNGVNWYTFDRMRGGGKYLWTDSTNVEASISNQDQFDHMDGLYTTNAYNYSSPLWIGYEWRRAPGFFDVVCYVGDGQAGRTVAHNLGAVPEMMWVKSRSAAVGWQVYHAALGNTGLVRLDNTLANLGPANTWNSTDPTATNFTLGSSTGNTSGYTWIAYLFATVPGISKVGSYTGTGGDLNVDCGFSAGARFVLIKRTDASGDWYVYDSTRGIAAGNDPYLLLNSTNGGVTNTDYIDPLASGFTVTSGAPAALNNTGGTYIFYAIA
jgi:hypothetical protein